MLLQAEKPKWVFQASPEAAQYRTVSTRDLQHTQRLHPQPFLAHSSLKTNDLRVSCESWDLSPKQLGAHKRGAKLLSCKFGRKEMEGWLFKNWYYKKHTWEILLHFSGRHRDILWAVTVSRPFIALLLTPTFPRLLLLWLNTTILSIYNISMLVLEHIEIFRHKLEF